MKKLFMFIVLFALLSSDAICGDHVPLKQRPNNGHQGHKAPTNLSYLPTVDYDAQMEVLSFEANSDLGLVPYTVTDADDNVVLSGYIYIYVGTTPTVSVSSLTAATTPTPSGPRRASRQ